MKHELSEVDKRAIKFGEGITLTAIMAICAIAVVAVIVYRLFLSQEGSTTIPGGWKFSWE